MTKTKTAEKQALACFRSWDHAKLLFCDKDNPIRDIIEELQDATGILAHRRSKSLVSNFVNSLHGLDNALLKLEVPFEERVLVFKHTHWSLENFVDYDISTLPWHGHKVFFHWDTRNKKLKPVYPCKCNKNKLLSRRIKCLHYLNLFLECKGYPKMNTQWYK